MFGLKRFAPFLVFPAILGLAVATTALGVQRGMAPLVVANGVSAAIFLALLGLERWLPYQAEWNRPDGQRWNDFGHLLFGTALGSRVGAWLTEVLFNAAYLRRWTGSSLWASAMGSTPLALQVCLVWLIADLGRYVQHRLMHRYACLWRFHSLHHSGESMNVFKTSRSHLAERIFQQAFMFGPLLAAGVPPRVLLFYVVPNTFLGLLDHSNVDFRLGRLERIFMGPMGHRMHHARNSTLGNSNFGSALALWDRLFGTFADPLTIVWDGRMGIPGDPTPGGFIQQVLEPWSGFSPVEGFRRGLRISGGPDPRALNRAWRTGKWSRTPGSSSRKDRSAG